MLPFSCPLASFWFFVNCLILLFELTFYLLYELISKQFLLKKSKDLQFAFERMSFIFVINSKVLVQWWIGINTIVYTIVSLFYFSNVNISITIVFIDGQLSYFSVGIFPFHFCTYSLYLCFGPCLYRLVEDTAWQPIWRDEFDSVPLLRKGIILAYSLVRPWMSIAHWYDLIKLDFLASGWLLCSVILLLVWWVTCSHLFHFMVFMFL